MKFISTLFLTLLSSFAIAQSGTIKGRISTENGDPAESINIILKGTGKGTTTSVSGEFSLSDLAAGNYQLTASGVGYASIERKVSLAAGETLMLNLTVQENAQQLQTVEITGRRETTYKNDVSFIASKTATPIKEVPQAISYVTKEVLRDQGAFTMGDAVKNMSGVNQFTFYDDLTIRGFRMNGGSTTQLFNGLRTFSGFWK
nr:carboxypeptidase-like regulatory domain-containing protein [Spirosoma validum]